MKPWPAHLVIPALALALAGCGMGVSSGQQAARSELIPVLPASAPVGSIPGAPVRPGDPLVGEARRIATLLLPDPAGDILRVKEKHFQNGTRQEIITATDKGTYGENVIDVSLRTTDASRGMSAPLLTGPPSENGIRNEILSRFPDVQMNIVTRPMSNSIGPFGLAIGKHPGGARCVFAWQWTEDLRGASGTPGLAGVSAMLSGKTVAASIRIRLCRSDSTLDQLASYIESLRLSMPAIDRVVAMDRRNVDGEASAGSGSSLLKPVGGVLETAIAKPGKPAAAARQQAKPRRARIARAPSRPREQAAAPVPPPVFVPPQYPAAQPSYGPRYLAPVGGAAPPPVYGVPAQGGASAGTATLPPQAFRGPGQ